MAVSIQKLKTLRVMQILLEKTDENHMLSAQGIIDLLELQYGMSCDRKSIYSDVELLQEFGLDIVQQKGTNPGYYVASRDFELPELKLLVDAVQSSKFITEKKSEELIEKLKKETSEAFAKQLQRQVYIHNRPKTDNETIYYNVDKIHNAIYLNKKVQFKYTEWTPEGKQQFRYDGYVYTTSPWALTWDDEFYYLIAYDAKHSQMIHFRLDRMRQMDIIDEEREGADEFAKFDMGQFTKKTFSMFHGQDERVTLICKNQSVGIAIDRFGKDISFMKEDDEHVRFSTVVTISPQFFGWLTGVGTEIKLKGPDWLKDEYIKYLEDVFEQYK